MQLEPPLSGRVGCVAQQHVHRARRTRAWPHRHRADVLRRWPAGRSTTCSTVRCSVLTYVRTKAPVPSSRSSTSAVVEDVQAERPVAFRGGHRPPSDVPIVVGSARRSAAPSSSRTRSTSPSPEAERRIRAHAAAPSRSSSRGATCRAGRRPPTPLDAIAPRRARGRRSPSCPTDVEQLIGGEHRAEAVGVREPSARRAARRRGDGSSRSTRRSSRARDRPRRLPTDAAGHPRTGWRSRRRRSGEAKGSQRGGDSAGPLPSGGRPADSLPSISVRSVVAMSAEYTQGSTCGRKTGTKTGWPSPRSPEEAGQSLRIRGQLRPEAVAIATVDDARRLDRVPVLVERRLA